MVDNIATNTNLRSRPTVQINCLLFRKISIFKNYYRKKDFVWMEMNTQETYEVNFLTVNNSNRRPS